MLRHKLEELERLTQRGKLFRDLRRAAAVFLDRPERLVILLLEGCHSFCSKLSIRACVRLIIIVVLSLTRDNLRRWLHMLSWI